MIIYNPKPKKPLPWIGGDLIPKGKMKEKLFSDEPPETPDLIIPRDAKMEQLARCETRGCGLPLGERLIYQGRWGRVLPALQ